MRGYPWKGDIPMYPNKFPRDFFGLETICHQVTRWKTPTLHRRLHRLWLRWHRWRLHQVLGRGKEEITILTNMFLQLAFWNHHLVDHILKCLFLTGGAIDQVPKSNCGQSQCMTRWWFSKIFIFTPTWGKDPIWIWRAYFSIIGLVQPPTRRWNETPTRFPGKKRPCKACSFVGQLYGWSKPQAPSSQWNKWHILGSRNLPTKCLELWDWCINVSGVL